jgi:preprotein translocase subunit Sec61beta
MARSNKISMPSSGAGITSYYEESEGKFLLSPQTVLILIVLITVVVVLL